MVILSYTCVIKICVCWVFGSIGFELHCNSQSCSGMKEASSTTSKKKNLQAIYKPVCMPLLLQAADQIMVWVSWGFKGSCICQSLLVNIVSICIWKTLADSLNALINAGRKLKLNRKSFQLTSEYYVFHEVCVRSLFLFKLPVMFWLSTVSFYLLVFFPGQWGWGFLSEHRLVSLHLNLLLRGEKKKKTFKVFETRLMFSKIIRCSQN